MEDRKMADVNASTHDDNAESAAKRRKMDDAPGDMVAAATVGIEGGPVQAACLRMREKILAVERDYTHYFALDVGGEAGADQYVYQHFNTLCIVGIAPSSVAFAGGRKVTQVDFDVGRSGDKTDAKKPSGKKKIGAMCVPPSVAEDKQVIHAQSNFIVAQPTSPAGCCRAYCA